VALMRPLIREKERWEMLRNHKKGLERMFQVEADEVISQEVRTRVDQAELLLSRMGKQREFPYAWLAILLADCKTLKEKKAEIVAAVPPEPVPGAPDG